MSKKILISLILVFGFIFFVRTQIDDDTVAVVDDAAEAVVNEAPVDEAFVPEEPIDIEKDIAPEDIREANQELFDQDDQGVGVSGVDQDVDFDHEGKRKAIVNLVKKGIAYLKGHSFSDACNKFTHTKDFIEGELYLFLFDFKGTNFAHGQQADLLWKNLYDMRDSFGTLIVQEIINKAKEGGGWITYEWRAAAKVSYSQEVRKDGKSYAIGCGYYPHSKPDAVVSLVKSAVTFFNKTIEEGGLPEDGFSPFSYPIGRFVYGDLYLYALDFKGNNLAHGDRPGLIGTNAWTYQDPTGKFVNQTIISKLKEKELGEGIWIDYISKRASKKAYAERVVDAKGNQYFVACGYYPDANRDAVVELVRRGYQYMKTHGKSRAAKDFSDKRKSDFRFGDLYLVVFDMKGMVVAHGGNPEFIGRNHYDRQDGDGRYYVRELIQKAKEGGGWIDIKFKKSFLASYYEKIDLGVDEFIIGAGVYPVSKHETMILLAKSAADFLENNDTEIAFREFVNKNGQFVRGDITIFAFDIEGLCYAYGDDYNLIWRNLINVTDDEGKPFVQGFVNMIKHGFGTTRYTLNGVPKIAYVESVQKNGTTYIIGSSYYK